MRRRLISFSIALILLSFGTANLPAQVEATKQSADDDIYRVYKPGKDISPPILISSVEPTFSKQLRKSKVKGTVLVNLYVERNGQPSNVHAVRMRYVDKKGQEYKDSDNTVTGKQLTELAVQAVQQYRFKPAMKDGNPVRVELNVEVNFDVY